MLLSVIIPTLNEEKTLPETLQNVVQYGENIEVIVVDGGSEDDTLSVAKAHNVKVFQSGPGRGRQLNMGASFAQGDILLFLHADTRLPKEYYSLVCLTMAREEIAAGAFRLAIDSPQKIMQYVAWGANFRSSVFQLPYGDQGVFIRKSLFQELGGYPDLPIMEDFSFIRQAKRKGCIQTVDAAVITSARRWQKFGVVRTTVLNQVLILGFLLGLSPKFLAKLYGVGKKI